jgi:catalase (peroxidase I)
MDKPGWDDGSIAPILIRLAWHSSGTYDRFTKTGGSNNCGKGGATMRFGGEASDPENIGLEKGREFLEPIKQKNPFISYADLWILASYVAIEQTGGP